MNNPTTSNRIALITGASRGIGRSDALSLAAQGVDIIVTYLTSAAEAERVVKQIKEMGRRAVALQLDIGSASTFSRFAEDVRTVLQHTWQRENFDFLVNNAGTGVYATLADTTEEEFDLMTNTHLKGTFFLTQKLLPLIVDGGRIINTSSGLTRFTFTGYAAYAAAKGGIEVLTRFMAKELGPRNISVNVIAPGATETDFGGGALRDNADLNTQFGGMTALSRNAVPDDIGGVVAALLSENAGWINGQRIEASGGLLL
ncbi:MULTISPECIES: SDR family NAD(P)-dependent oxidoreductase [Pectobacterium]|uniref:SDR family oxidoreductase n=1 Tax=Pectobacterium brasiliense TaxID=180957 RepID=A0AAE2WIB8_9GAMM|nr:MULTISPECIES: SDR family oxidoreductase [Pectobacterium]KHS80932.1 short-chain dehydrogenase [Pectobacterium carotovorum subsp. carotovorum]MBN3053748.1 SDR family oxidoreductase [Pectobacterium brasiliense]MCH5050876.1 SDR family oxidoreductase [Pectobacterium aquaticum]RRN93125.1 SDR family oxidoreductase [Pectobacterium aquaticum]ULS44810.1 SDR family oxidoreductase [Pectobacterium carotovorum]